MTLDSVCSIVRGERITKADLSNDGPYPVISGGYHPMGHYNRYNRNANMVTIAQYGSAGYVDWQKKPFWANDVCYTLYSNEMIIERYLYHVLKLRQNELYSLRTEAIPAHLPFKALTSFLIPVPSFETQKNIVKILDEFENLCYDLEKGIPAEIEARKKQYEYYRDKLLSFKENSA